MSKPEPATTDECSAARPVFVSHASADRKQALAICKALERRGVRCWISCRNVAPGENYQEEIVRAIRSAPAVVLVFSEAANNSDEIKKELSLASRHHVPTIALRIEDVEPSDAFAYELSTRQWIDAFDGRDRAIDSLVERIGQIANAEPVASTAAAHGRRGTGFFSRRAVSRAVTLGLLLIAAGVASWWALRPRAAAAHSMTVRLAGFQLLSADLPAAMHDAVGSEIIAAFNADGVIGVSTNAAPPSGTGPAYALGGTIHRDGDSIRVITRFTNERTGAILWSDSADYAADQAAKVPHKIAVDAGTVIRCGLFGASTYRKPLPDAAFGNYMQYCQQYWSYGGSKTLHFAKRVVAAVPDFSWGWSALANGFMQASQAEGDRARAEQMRAAGRSAADKAVALDPTNSEALAHKTLLIDPNDRIGQENLLKRAIAAQPLDCGCEHFIYGLMLQQVGRLEDASEQFRTATDMLALWPDSEFALADALVATGHVEEARSHFDSAIDLSKEPNFDEWLAVTEGTETGDYAAAIAALGNSSLKMPEETRAALSSGYQALASGDPRAKAKAVQALMALSKENQGDTLPMMLAALGANREALQVASQTPSLFWHRSMRGVLDDPKFPAIADRLGLMRYWRTTNARPDVCSAKNAPRFCRMI